jgi:hypothetical protein
LTSQGYQVTALSDFMQAKERLRTQQFNVLITDCNAVVVLKPLNPEALLEASHPPAV